MDADLVPGLAAGTHKRNALVLLGYLLLLFVVGSALLAALGLW
jgi:hypothetical protein